MRMVGLNVTRKALVLPDVMERMSHIDTKAGRMFIELMKFFNRTQKEVFGLEAGPLHDPMTIASLIDQRVLKFAPMQVKINLERGPRYAETACMHLADSKILVAKEVDVDAYWNVIAEGLEHYK